MKKIVAFGAIVVLLAVVAGAIASVRHRAYQAQSRHEQRERERKRQELREAVDRTFPNVSARLQAIGDWCQSNRSTPPVGDGQPPSLDRASTLVIRESDVETEIAALEQKDPEETAGMLSESLNSDALHKYRKAAFMPHTYSVPDAADIDRWHKQICGAHVVIIRELDIQYPSLDFGLEGLGFGEPTSFVSGHVTYAVIVLDAETMEPLWTTTGRAENSEVINYSYTTNSRYDYSGSPTNRMAAQAAASVETSDDLWRNTKAAVRDAMEPLFASID